MLHEYENEKKTYHLFVILLKKELYIENVY